VLARSCADLDAKKLSVLMCPTGFLGGDLLKGIGSPLGWCEKPETSLGNEVNKAQLRRESWQQC